MVDKLNHTVAVQGLHDIITESEHQANSGDVRVAQSARRDFLLASIGLQFLSAIEPEHFNNVELATYPTPDELRAAENPEEASTLAPKPPENADELDNANEGSDTVGSAPDKFTADDLASDNVATDTNNETADLTPVSEPIGDTNKGDDVVSSPADDNTDTTDTNNNGGVPAA